jgi:hypothetical protein
MYQNLWATNNYVYHTTSSGIDVYNSDASLLLDHIEILNVTSVWSNDTYVYIGTSVSGIYRATISGVAVQYYYLPNITSNNVIYLHGSGEFLCATTESGVDHYNVVSGTRIYTSVSGSGKCFQSSTGPFYYTTVAGLNAVYSVDLNWSIPDYTYSDELLYVSSINDIHVTEGTSSYNNENTIFLATDAGCHIIEERRGNEANSTIKRYFII